MSFYVALFFYVLYLCGVVPTYNKPTLLLALFVMLDSFDSIPKTEIDRFLAGSKYNGRCPQIKTKAPKGVFVFICGP